MEKQVLIVIDMQRGFSEPVWGQRNNPNLEDHVAALLAEWRRRQWPVIHIRHNSKHANSPLRPGQVGNDFMECALPRSGELMIEKTVNSAFIGTRLQAYLDKAGLKHLAFAGLTSDHCVSTSVRMAANLGFTVSVFAEATASFPRLDYEGGVIEAELVHKVALASLSGEFATIVTGLKLTGATFLQGGRG